MKRARVVLLLAGVALAAAYVTLRAQSSPAANRNVATVYTETCANCHGPALAGGPAPSLLDDVWAHGGDDESIAKSIREGWPATGMPAFRGALSDQAVRTLVIYIRELRAKAASGAAPPAVRRPAPDEVFRSERHAFRLETVVDNFETPWGIAFLPDGTMLFTERSGQLRRVVGGKLDPIVIGGLPPIWVRQDGGLMDVAVHPDYATNGWIYLALTEPGGTAPGASSTRIIRGRLRDNQLVDQETLFKAPPALYWDDNSHYGARFLFGRQNVLFFSIGDRGHMPDAQDLASPYGKLHRIHDDGRIPSDNPFVDRPGASKSVWSYGHRNQQGLAFDPVTGDLWTTEHGPRGGDEINLTVKGKNYGWPVVTYGMNYDGTPISDKTAQPAMESPAAQWTPTIAPSGITFYTGDRFPEWKNHLFVACLAGQQLRRLEITGPKVTHQEIVFSGLGRVRDVVMGPDGYLYVATNTPGRIFRIVPAS